MDAFTATHRTRPAPEVGEQVLWESLVQARFEALAEWGVELTDARAVALEVSIDIVEVVELLQNGCPSALVLSILA